MNITTNLAMAGWDLEINDNINNSARYSISNLYMDGLRLAFQIHK